MIKPLINKKILRNFSYIFGIGFPFFIGLFFPYFSGHDFKAWTILVGLPVIMLGNIKPKLLTYPYLLWMKIGYILGWINSRLILGIIFIFIMQPMALIMKIFKYDPLKLKIDKNKKTYRQVIKNKDYDFKRIF
tara:strand:- start:304 stop:702 length:399 start_codon:yes stop_codon:yes gene_type:complete